VSGIEIVNEHASDPSVNAIGGTDQGVHLPVRISRT